MTRTTLAGLYNSYNDAILAVHEIEAAGVPQSDISLVANNAEGRHETTGHTNAGPDAEAGAEVGAVVGGGAGLLVGLGLLAIPGIGPVVAAGWLTATLLGAVAGEAVGAATGGLIGSLTKAGVSTDAAHVYAESVRRGGALVMARVDETRLETVAAILSSHRSVDADALGRRYRDEGWTAFNEDAIPYTAAELKTQRDPNLTDTV